MRHVPTVGGADLEHLLRQRCEFGAHADEGIECALLSTGHLRSTLRQCIDLFLIERPEALELRFERRIGGEQVGADRANRHRHAAAGIGKSNQQAFALVGRGDAAFLIDNGGNFLQHEFGERGGLGRKDFCSGLLIDGVRDRFGLVLRIAQFVEQRFGLLPIQLVLLDRPMAGDTIHLRAVFLNSFPKPGAFGLERLVAGNQPAAQRRQRGINSRHQITRGHGRRNPKVDGPLGRILDRANFDDCDADDNGQESAKRAETENQSSSNVQLQKSHDEFPPMQAVDRQVSEVGCALTLKNGIMATRTNTGLSGKNLNSQAALSSNTSVLPPTRYRARSFRFPQTDSP